MKTLRELLEFVLVWFAILWLGAAVKPAVSATTPDEEWFVVRIADTPVGWVRTASEPEEQEVVEHQEMEIALNRMGSVIRMSSSTTTREASSGELRSVDYEVLISGQATRFQAVIEPGRVRITDEAGDRQFERQVDYEGVLLGPAAARARFLELPPSEDEKLTYRTFRAELAAVTDVTLAVVGRESIIRDGRSVEAWRAVESLSDVPLETTVWLDEHGRVLRSAAQSPFGLMEAIATDAATARLAGAGGELPEESFSGTLVPTQVRLPQPRRSTRVVLELRHRNPDLGWPELNSPNQSVLESTDDRLVVEVRRRTPARRATFPVEESEASRPYLQANAYLQSDDPEARELAREIVGEMTDVLEAGLALERWVAENMRFDMGVVMAPSNEVLEERRGTCTEYAVLLTTLARSLDIPARFVMGYVYAGGIFGGHAWTEVLIGDEWIALDGAIVGQGPADASRLAFQWSSLNEGIGMLNMGPGVQLFGQIDLAVLEYDTSDAEPYKFAPDETAFTVEGDRYVNRSLGVAWVKPGSYRFGELDATWPETGLVGLDGPDGARAELAVRDRRPWIEPETAARLALEREVGGSPTEAIVSGIPALRAAGPGRAALAWTRGSEVWILSVDGEHAERDLEALAATLEL